MLTLGYGGDDLLAVFDLILEVGAGFVVLGAGKEVFVDVTDGDCGDVLVG